MDKELAWFIVPVAAMLSQIGGTWWKPARRIGIPVALTLTLIWLGISPYKSILSGFWVFIGAILPITIGKGDIRKWYQFLWLWFLGYFLGVGAIFISLQALWIALIPCVVFGGLGTLSNIPSTAKYVPWKFFEAIVWAFVVYPYVLLATLRT